MVKTGKKSGRVKTEKRAVIDIGSNSVRLVIFDGPRRTPLAILNEKVLCGLGRDRDGDGNLSDASMRLALQTLTRFKLLLDAHANPPVTAIATAAVREAGNGPDFVAKIEALGLEVTIIDGREEAQLAAHGVLAYRPNATGIVGDLGGGSLELMHLKEGAMGAHDSLSIGPFNLMTRTKGDRDAARKMIREEIASLAWLKEADAGKPRTFIAVGGAWRAIARMHMALRDYPLDVLHGYRIDADDAIDLCRLISNQSMNALERMPGVSRRRLDTLPYAAMVLGELIDLYGFRQILLSTGGVREGLLFRALNETEREADPLHALGYFLAEQVSPAPSTGPLMFDLLTPLFEEESDELRRLRFFICLLSDGAAYFHPNFRGDHAFQIGLWMPITGLSHHERLITAFSLFHRYEGRSRSEREEKRLHLLSEAERDYALQLGLGLRFLSDLSPKAAEPLKRVAFAREKDRLVCLLSPDVHGLDGELPLRRLTAFAGAFDLEPEIRLIDD